MAMFGVTLSSQTATSLGQMVILWKPGPCTTHTMSYRSLGPRGGARGVYPRAQGVAAGLAGGLAGGLRVGGWRGVIVMVGQG